MAYYDEDKVFSEQIRDTNVKTSIESKSGEFLAKTIFIENGLNQAVTLQLQGARNAVWLNVGIPFVVNASTNIYETVSDFFPKYRMTAQCSIAPTTGVLDVYLIKAHGG